jgi:ABC transporter substrate binding protein
MYAEIPGVLVKGPVDFVPILAVRNHTPLAQSGRCIQFEIFKEKPLIGIFRFNLFFRQQRFFGHEKSLLQPTRRSKSRAFSRSTFPAWNYSFCREGKSMRRQIMILAFLVQWFIGFAIANAQQSAKVPRIGYQGAGSYDENEEAFRQGLRELGYVEGQNIVIEWRFAEGKPDQVPRNAAELVRLKVDVIVTGGPTDTRAAKGATSTIPIVMTNESDPIGTGFVASLSRPGGNITGLATLSAELDGKRLEPLKETLPRLSHVVALQGPGAPKGLQ